MLTIVLVLVFLAASLGAYLALSPSDTQLRMAARLASIRRRPAAAITPADEELTKPFSERVLRPFFDQIYRRVLRVTPVGMKEKVRRRLNEAGRPMDTGRFLGLKALLALTLGLLGTLLAVARLGSGPPLNRFVLPVVLLALGSFLPEFWLSSQVTKRRKALERALPDVLDLLSVSVEAGLGFDGAVQKVAEKFGEPVSGEFTSYLKEVRLGKSRADALRNLADRTELTDMRTFTAAVIQAEQLGASLSKVLRMQAEGLRVKRKQRAEEKAMKAPVKMLFPLVMFIFPTLFIVILGPVGIHVMEAFK